MSNNKKHEKMNTTIEKTTKIIGQLTNDFKINYMAMCENWFQFQFDKNVELIQQYNQMKNDLTKPVSQFRTAIVGTDSQIYALKCLEKTTRTMDQTCFDFVYCLNQTPEKFSRYFATFEAVETKMTNAKQSWINKQMIKTDKMFDLSLLKIVNVILANEMDVDSMEISKIEMNNGIDITLIDGKQKIHAFTIIACGQIVKPHFRFLVKIKK